MDDDNWQQCPMFSMFGDEKYYCVHSNGAGHDGAHEYVRVPFADAAAVVQSLRVGFERVTRERDEARAELTRVREAAERGEDALRRESDYCYGYATKYANHDAERAGRHRERGDRLLAAADAMRTALAEQEGGE